MPRKPKEYIINIDDEKRVVLTVKHYTKTKVSSIYFEKLRWSRYHRSFLWGFSLKEIDSVINSLLLVRDYYNIMSRNNQNVTEEVVHFIRKSKAIRNKGPLQIDDINVLVNDVSGKNPIEIFKFDLSDNKKNDCLFNVVEILVNSDKKENYNMFLSDYYAFGWNIKIEENEKVTIGCVDYISLKVFDDLANLIKEKVQ